MVNRALKVGGATLAALALLSPSVVRAQELPPPLPLISDVLVFTGQATTAPPVALVGGGGGYTFDTQPVGFCVSESDACRLRLGDGEHHERGSRLPAHGDWHVHQHRL